MTQHKIYALCEPGVSDETGKIDPDTIGVIGYVGVTTQTLDKRLNQHISEASKGKGGAKKHAWIADILQAGQHPIIIELDRCGGEEWPDREQFWVSLFRSRGYVLTNTTDGGVGQPGLQHTEATKEKISESMKAYKAQEH
jgi:hypothetical protein